MPDDKPTPNGQPQTPEEKRAQEAGRLQSALTIVSKGLAWSKGDPKDDSLSAYDYQQNNAAAFQIISQFAQAGFNAMFPEPEKVETPKPNRAQRRSKSPSRKGAPQKPKLEAVPAAEG